MSGDTRPVRQEVGAHPRKAASMILGGLDIGNSGCKFVTYRPNGEVVHKAKRDYPDIVAEGRRELDPEIVFTAVVEVLRETVRQVDEPISGIAIATLGEAAVLTGADGRAICNSMVTGDSRGVEESHRLVEKYGADRLMEITGVPPSEMFGLPRYIWLNANTAHIRNAERFFLFEDFIAYRLTGSSVLSYSSASRSMMFDVNALDWSRELIAEAGIDYRKLSRPVPAGTVIGGVTAEAAVITGLQIGTSVVAGGHDQTCAAFGAGVIDPEIIEDGLGSCEVMTAVLHGDEDREQMLRGGFPRMPYVLPNAFVTYNILTVNGLLLNWFKKTFFPDCPDGKELFTRLDSEIIPGDTGGIIVLPLFGSQGNPDIDYDARGAICGLHLGSTPVQIYAAVKEGMAFQMLLGAESLRQTFLRAPEIRMTSGLAQSATTMQLRADVFNVRTAAMQSEEAGTLGCMMLAGVALGVYRDHAEAVGQAVYPDKTYHPDPAMHAVYMAKYEKYKEARALIGGFR